MPSTCCSVPQCSNRGGHVYPNDEKLKKKWIKAIRRNSDKNRYWKPSKSSVVCRSHFKPTDFLLETSRGTETLVKRLKKEAIPSVFPWTSTFASPSSLQRKERQTRREVNNTVFDTDSDTTSEENDTTELNGELDSLDIGSEIYYTAEKIDDSESNLENNQIERDQNPLTDSNTQTQTWPALCVEKFEDDPAGLMFYTGLQSNYDFTFVLASLGNAAYHLNYVYFRSEQLSVENQFFLTLVKLRQHKTNFELSRLFNISETAVINIWITWINFMYHQWKEINIWPQRDLVRFFSPYNFRRLFPSTRVIIDGTECPVRKPRSPIAQQSTFSTYKNRNTIKILVGATPGGLVSYVSPSFGGSTSDRQICERSNLMTKCDQGDSIMADKGFNVQDLFAPYDVSINIPTFFRKKNRMTCKTVMKDRKISSKRVHIERIIGLAKTFKILKEPLNIAETKLATEITFVCFMLCNFKNCIIPAHA